MPNQYQLLRHAVTLADQLEAAGLPEGRMYDDRNGSLLFRWEPRHLNAFHWPQVRVYSDGRAQSQRDRYLSHTFRVGDPLPPELIAAIKATEDADA